MTFMGVIPQLAPCVNGDDHNFVAHFPPAGTFGFVQVICSRCGLSDRDARR